MTERPAISQSRLILGAAVLIVGFCGPLFIPLVTNSGLSIGFKTTLSGLLAFGIPEIFMLIAISILGKPGYEYVKSKLVGVLRKLAPDEISQTRHRIGVVLFVLPLVFGFLQPYLGHYFEFFKNIPLWFYIIGDLVFFTSIIILGGRFWDKLQRLFLYNQ